MVCDMSDKSDLRDTSDMSDISSIGAVCDMDGHLSMELGHSMWCALLTDSTRMVLCSDATRSA